jgi:hypothetical protein
MRRAFGLLIFLTLAACGAPAPTGPPVAIQSPPPGKAQVYIIRPKTIVGSGNLMITRINGVVVSQLQVGQYTIVPVEPGEVVLTMRNRIQVPLPQLDLRLLKEIAGFQEIGRVTLAAGQTAFMEYHWVKWTDADEASRLLGAGPAFVAPVNVGGS